MTLIQNYSNELLCKHKTSIIKLFIYFCPLIFNIDYKPNSIFIQIIKISTTLIIL